MKTNKIRQEQVKQVETTDKKQGKTDKISLKQEETGIKKVKQVKTGKTDKTDRNR